MLTLLRVEGMMCGHCTSSVETALRAVPEVREVSVDLESKLARVDGSASAEALIEAVQSVGHASELVPGTVLRVEGMSNDRPRPNAQVQRARTRTLFFFSQV